MSSGGRRTTFTGASRSCRHVLPVMDTELGPDAESIDLRISDILAGSRRSARAYPRHVTRRLRGGVTITRLT